MRLYFAIGGALVKKNIVAENSFRFAVRITKLHKYLQKEKAEYILSRQLLRAGTSIGANIMEAQRAQSRADFLSKMSIALKEANETQYWLRLLYHAEYLSAAGFRSMHRDLGELLSLLTAICKKVKSEM